MGKLAPKLDKPAEVYDAQKIRDQLHYWRSHWVEVVEGTSALTDAEVWKQLDRWLDIYAISLERRTTA